MIKNPSLSPEPVLRVTGIHSLGAPFLPFLHTQDTSGYKDKDQEKNLHVYVKSLTSLLLFFVESEKKRSHLKVLKLAIHRSKFSQCQRIDPRMGTVVVQNTNAQQGGFHHPLRVCGWRNWVRYFIHKSQFGAYIGLRSCPHLTVLCFLSIQWEEEESVTFSQMNKRTRNVFPF